MSRQEVLCVIPARGGSKGIPRKNTVLLAGKPLVSYTIEAAINAQRITRVIVSTEDVEIASIVKSYGAEVPFLRSSELAADDVHSLARDPVPVPDFPKRQLPGIPIPSIEYISLPVICFLEYIIGCLVYSLIQGFLEDCLFLGRSVVINNIHIPDWH